jgi:hypothetical protein
MRGNRSVGVLDSEIKTPTTHVGSLGLVLWTRVRFPPPPPFDNSIQSGAGQKPVRNGGFFVTIGPIGHDETYRHPGILGVEVLYKYPQSKWDTRITAALSGCGLILRQFEQPQCLWVMIEQPEGAADSPAPQKVAAFILLEHARPAAGQ